MTSSYFFAFSPLFFSTVIINDCFVRQFIFVDGKKRYTTWITSPLILLFLLILRSRRFFGASHVRHIMQSENYQSRFPLGMTEVKNKHLNEKRRKNRELYKRKKTLDIVVRCLHGYCMIVCPWKIHWPSTEHREPNTSSTKHIVEPPHADGQSLLFCSTPYALNTCILYSLSDGKVISGHRIKELKRKSWKKTAYRNEEANRVYSATISSASWWATNAQQCPKIGFLNSFEFYLDFDRSLDWRVKITNRNSRPIRIRLELLESTKVAQSKQ